MAHAQHTAPAKAFSAGASMRAGVATAAALSTALGVAACNRGSSTDTAGGGGESPVGVVLITKDSTNLFFVAMQGRQGRRSEEQRQADGRLRQAGG